MANTDPPPSFSPPISPGRRSAAWPLSRTCPSRPTRAGCWGRAPWGRRSPSWAPDCSSACRPSSGTSRRIAQVSSRLPATYWGQRWLDFLRSFKKKHICIFFWLKNCPNLDRLAGHVPRVDVVPYWGTNQTELQNLIEDRWCIMNWITNGMHQSIYSMIPNHLPRQVLLAGRVR